MQLIIHTCQHIPGNKLIQTHETQNYQVFFCDTSESDSLEKTQHCDPVVDNPCQHHP